MCSSIDFCLAVIAFFFPPVAVCLKRGCCSADTLINICLCILGVLPGIIHAWYIIAKYPSSSSAGDDLEGGGGFGVHHYVQQQGGHPQYGQECRGGGGGRGEGRGGQRLLDDHTQQVVGYGTVSYAATPTKHSSHEQGQSQGPSCQRQAQASSSRVPSKDDAHPSVPPPPYQESVGLTSDHKIQVP